MARADERRARLVGTVAELTEAKGFAPTIRELAAELDYASTASVYKDLVWLRDAGEVTWQPNCFRTLRLIETHATTPGV